MTAREKSTQTDQSLVATGSLFSLRLKDVLKFISSLLLPLTLGVFTVIITVQQHEVVKQQREQDRRSSELQREQEKHLNDERYKNDRLDSYIKEMGKLLEKHDGSIISSDVGTTLARVKTLNIFRQLDPQRTARVIRFLYEAKQLTDTRENRSLDLSTAELFDADFRNSSINKKKLNNLSLTSMYLSNTTFIGLEMGDINFAGTQFNIVNLSLSNISHGNFSSTTFNNANFSHANLSDTTFEKAQLKNMYFSYTHMKNVGFTCSSLRNINFSNVSLINVELSSTRFEHANFTHAQLFNTSFKSGTLQNVDFSFALMNDVDFSSIMKLSNVNFSYARLGNVNFSGAQLVNASFLSAELSYSDFQNAQFQNTSFSFVILVSANFERAQASFTNFGQANAILARFDGANLNYSNFSHANIKRASFVRAHLTEVVFSRVNLYKVNFTGNNITDEQLHSALSIQDVLLQNETLARDTNLINNGQHDCTSSGINGWTLKRGNVSKVMFDKNSINCQFTLQSISAGATMYQRVILSGRWDSSSWSYSQAVLRANMSIGIAVELRAISSNDLVLARHSLYSSGTSNSLILSDEIRELEVFIEFSANDNCGNGTNCWCSDIKLFIVCGTYLELFRGGEYCFKRYLQRTQN
ncbi:unnamed protein product [Rotaria magnacalcarata]|uniref:Pentapeptide repeat-containing protein n=2 Tax=Rotaria magnacalcarata TaxID=392030 RepID=A0A819Y1X7_9BILA|nr:unnamed protein product [Rotaria magnacalcarata]